ncbi:MAG TPA: VOC family protein [Acidimicrobiales bacterium]|nr:VOC family protein [Acidimicrobiales bacterium]
MTWTRLRQVALVAHDLDAVVGDLHDAFGLEVAYRDPAVAAFGLRNAVLPIGTQFIEVVSPTREGTAGGRQLERLGGDGGYMVICHTDDQPHRRARVDELGVRVAFEAEDHGYRIMQLHPADTGGSFLEIDFQPGGEDPTGPWMPAGPDWQRAVRTDVVDGITGVTVQSVDPARTAARWAEILELPVVDGTIELDNATVRFLDGPVDSLVAVTVRGPAPVEERVIGGVRFSPADA